MPFLEGRYLTATCAKIGTMSHRYAPCTLATSVVEGFAYHGTNRDFDRFDASFIGAVTDAGTLGVGFYFSSLFAVAQSYAEWVVWKTGEGQPIVKTVRLLLCNPYYVTRANMPRHLENDPRAARRFTQGLRRQGHDGVLHTLDHRSSGGEVFHEFVVYAPDQIMVVL